MLITGHEKVTSNYISKNLILVPCITSKHTSLSLPPRQALLIFKSKGQSISGALLSLLDKHLVILPSSSTDFFQPLDVSLNKSPKRRKFQEWFAGELSSQLKVTKKSALTLILNGLHVYFESLRS